MIILIIICALYVILMISLIYGWQQVPDFSPEATPPEIGFSVIIPFRNEVENLPSLLTSLARLQYPSDRFEILLVNDESEDNSTRICREFQKGHPTLSVQLLENQRKSGSPKKDALSTAIKKAKFSYILTTDADCVVPDLWLQTFNDFILQTAAKLVAGPVSLLPDSEKVKKPYFQIFEGLEMLSLQASTAGAFGLDKPFMCNGANLCYEKEAFLKVEGFKENEKISSGDDVFLLQKFKQERFKVAFLKSREAIVYTRPQEKLRQLVSQHIRWAAKAPAYKSLFSKFTGATVLLMNAGLIVAAALTLLKIWPYYPVLVIFLLKFNFDFALLYLSAKFFKREMLLRSYFWGSIAYPFFSTYTAVLSLYSGFEWKGRKFSK